MLPIAVLFLDVDGVLVPGYGSRPARRCLTELCALLGQVPDLRIVLSSSWRNDAERMGTLEESFAVAGISRQQRAGNTPDFIARRDELGLGLRGHEILGWLRTEPQKRGWEVRAYAAVDDRPESIAPPVPPGRVVATEFERGWEPLHTRALLGLLV